MDWFVNLLLDRLEYLFIDPFVDWLVNLLKDNFVDQFINWFVNWYVYLFVDQFVNWLAYVFCRLICGLTLYLVGDLFVGWEVDKFIFRLTMIFPIFLLYICLPRQDIDPEVWMYWRIQTRV